MKKYLLLILTLIIIGGAITGIVYLNRQRAENEALMILERAENAIAVHDYEQAVVYLRDALDRTRQRDLRNRVALNLAQIGFQEESVEQIEEALESIHPDSNYYYKALYMQAQLYLDQEEISRARTLFEQVKENPDTQARGKYGLATIRYHEGEYRVVQPVFQELLDNHPDEEFIEDLKFKLGDVNYSLFMEGHPQEIFTIHSLQQGELLYHVARRYNVTPNLIMKLNNIQRAERVSPGKRLLIPEIEFSILIDKSANTLELKANGEFFNIYRVATGKQSWLTPSGEFEILEKLENPVWNDPQTGRTIPGGDPANELGTRWMPFYGKSIGIHGSIYPERIGQPASNGCVSMHMHEVEELYDLVTVGTPVKVID